MDTSRLLGAVFGCVFPFCTPKIFSLTPTLALMVMVLPMQSANAIGAGSGAISLTSLGSAYTQNFDTLASTGLSNTVLPDGWYLNEEGSSARVGGNYAAGTGSDNAGDVYSFGASGSPERAFGTLLSGSLTPTIGALFTNDTGAPVTSIDVSYIGEMWRAGVTNRNAADRLDFQLGIDATFLTTGTWIDYNSLDFNSPNIFTTAGALNGNSSANQTSLGFLITGLNIQNGQSFWIRWTDSDISSSDDGLAVDNFSLTPYTSQVPLPASVWLFGSGLLGLIGIARHRKAA